MKFKMLKAVFLGLALTVSGFSNAAMIINYYESNGDLIFDYSGSFNFNIASSSISSRNDQYIGNQGSSPIFYNMQSNYTSKTFSDESVTSATFWTIPQTYFNSSGSGDTFLFRYNSGSSINIWLDSAGYSTGSNISGQVIASGYSIASTGLIDWKATFNNGSDSIEIKARDVPEPSTLAILALGLIGLGARRFKK